MSLPLLFLSAHRAHFWSQVIGAAGTNGAALVPSLRRDRSFQGMAARILADAPPRFGVVCACLGACVAFEIVRAAPGRIRSLVLINASASPDAGWRADIRRRRIESLSSRTAFQALQAQGHEKTLSWMLAPESLADPVIVRSALRAIEPDARQVQLRQQIAMLERRDFQEVLKAIDAPTLIVAGAQDRMCPATQSVTMHVAIAGSRLEIIERCGHMAVIEQPAVLSGLLGRWRQAAAT